MTDHSRLDMNISATFALPSEPIGTTSGPPPKNKADPKDPDRPVTDPRNILGSRFRRPHLKFEQDRFVYCEGDCLFSRQSTKCKTQVFIKSFVCYVGSFGISVYTGIDQVSHPNCSCKTRITHLLVFFTTLACISVNHCGSIFGHSQS